MEVRFQITNLAVNNTVELHIPKESFEREDDLNIELNVSGHRQDTLHIHVPFKYLQIAPEFVSGWLRLNGYRPTTRVKPDGLVVITFHHPSKLPVTL